LDQLLQQFSQVNYSGPIPTDVVRILEPGLGAFLNENPQQVRALVERISQTEDIEEQATLFRNLAGAIHPQLPVSVRAPLATPVTNRYIKLVDAFQEASENSPALHSDNYNNSLHGDLADVLGAVLETKPHLIEELAEPIIEQYITAGKHYEQGAMPGNPLDLLQVCMVVDEERTRAALNTHWSKIKTVVSEDECPAIVDMLLCLGDSWAQEQLEAFSGEVSDVDHSRYRLRTPERAFLAHEILKYEKKIDPNIRNQTLDDAETQLLYTPINLVTYRVMEIRAQECYDRLQVVESAMRSDFETYATSSDNPILSDFNEWWAPIRERLKQLPNVELRGHTYHYTQ
jgi:hypothetical protein